MHTENAKLMTDVRGEHEIGKLPTLDDLVRTYLRSGLTGKSQETRNWYRKRLKILMDGLGSETIASSVMEADLLDWYAGLESRDTRWGGDSTHPQQNGGLSTAYLYSIVRAVRAFFRWQTEHGPLTEDPAAGLTLPALPRTGRAGIADGDVLRILRLAAEGLGDGLQERDLAALMFLESTGARLGGLVNLRLTSIGVGRPEPLCRRAIVREKFGEERAVFMSNSALEAMRAWLAVRPEIGEDAVFLGRATGGEWGALTSDGIYQLVKRYAEAAGVKKNYNPHQWRHRFGRVLAQAGMSLGNISQVMGHKDVSITVRFYGIFAVGELQESYDRYMPDTGAQL